jgi:hypothetical protein
MVPEGCHHTTWKLIISIFLVIKISVGISVIKLIRTDTTSIFYIYILFYYCCSIFKINFIFIFIFYHWNRPFHLWKRILWVLYHVNKVENAIYMKILMLSNQLVCWSKTLLRKKIIRKVQQMVRLWASRGIIWFVPTSQTA